MSIYAEDSGFTRELIPPGNYVARCYQMIQIGTVNGQFGLRKMVRIGWELPEELRVFDEAKGPQPLVISQEYGLSMNSKANLRQMLASWRGKDFTAAEAKKFDITKLLGVSCMLNIIHAPGVADPTKTYQKISSVSTIPKSMKAPKAILPVQVLSYEQWDQGVYESLPEFLRNKIMLSAEYQALKNPATLTHEPEAPEVVYNDDLPF